MKLTINEHNYTVGDDSYINMITCKLDSISNLSALWDDLEKATSVTLARSSEDVDTYYGVRLETITLDVNLSATICLSQKSETEILQEEVSVLKEIVKDKEAYAEWSARKKYKVGDIVSKDGTLYIVLQEHTAQKDWSPESTPALYRRMYGETIKTDAGDVIAEWVQPQGAHDAYKTGDKVTYNGKTWASIAEGNVWKPGEYGWEEA